MERRGFLGRLFMVPAVAPLAVKAIDNAVSFEVPAPEWQPPAWTSGVGATWSASAIVTCSTWAFPQRHYVTGGVPYVPGVTWYRV